MDDDWKSIEELGIEKGLERANKLVYELLKNRIVRFDVKRSLEICTYLLNHFIIERHFVPLEYADQTLNKEKELAELYLFQKYIERLLGIFIMIPMQYQTENKLTESQTDQVIDQLRVYGSFLNTFFHFHLNPTDLDFKEVDELLDDFVEFEYILPNLSFDEEYLKIIESKALEQLLDFSDPLKNIERFSYSLDDELLKESYQARNAPHKMYFTCDPILKNLPNYLLNLLNYGAIYNFGSNELISNLLDDFQSYYSTRIPSKTAEIKNHLDSFKILFRLTKGKLFGTFNESQVKKRIAEITSAEKSELFLNKFCLHKTFKTFPDSLEIFNPIYFIDQYNTFLSRACFSYCGEIYTGAPLIWRALVKYFEELHGSEEFRTFKGQLLENWCYNQAASHGFEVEKIILTNKDQTPTSLYHDMKDHITSFPRPPIEFNVEFIHGKDKFYFQEIDLLMRVESIMYVFECKGTSVSLSDESRIIKWSENFMNNYDLLNVKLDTLRHNIENGNINHPFLNDLELFIPLIIQTEGLFHTFALSPAKYLSLLKSLKQHSDDGTLRDLLL